LADIVGRNGALLALLCIVTVHTPSPKQQTQSQPWNKCRSPVLSAAILAAASCKHQSACASVWNSCAGCTASVRSPQLALTGLSWGMHSRKAARGFVVQALCSQPCLRQPGWR